MKNDEFPRDMGLRHEEGDTDPWGTHGLRGAVVLESDIGFKNGGTYIVLRLKSGSVISLQLSTTISGNLVRDDHDAEAPVKDCKCYTCKYAPKKQEQKE